jgi:hypothetical protein
MYVCSIYMEERGGGGGGGKEEIKMSIAIVVIPGHKKKINIYEWERNALAKLSQSQIPVLDRR